MIAKAKGLASHEAAIAALESAVALEPADAEIKRLLGDRHAALAREKEAARLAKEREEAVASAIARAAKTDSHEAAVEILEGALKLDSGNVQLQKLAGERRVARDRQREEERKAAERREKVANAIKKAKAATVSRIGCRPSEGCAGARSRKPRGACAARKPVSFSREGTRGGETREGYRDRPSDDRGADRQAAVRRRRCRVAERRSNAARWKDVQGSQEAAGQGPIGRRRPGWHCDDRPARPQPRVSGHARQHRCPGSRGGGGRLFHDAIGRTATGDADRYGRRASGTTCGACSAAGATATAAHYIFATTIDAYVAPGGPAVANVDASEPAGIDDGDSPAGGPGAKSLRCRTRPSYQPSSKAANC